MIKFSNSGHWYTKDGKPSHDSGLREARKLNLYPSVTSVERSVFVNEGLQIWKTNQLVIAASENYRQPHESGEQYAQRIYDLSNEKAKDAAEFGTALHDAIEKYPQMPLDPKLAPWFDKFSKWWDENVDVPIRSESVVVDNDIGVAGRLDRVVQLKNGRRCVIDFKTQDVKVSESGKKKPAFYDSWPRQLGFYSVCDAKDIHSFPQIADCMSLVIDSNEGGEIYQKMWDGEEIIDAYRCFVAGCYLYFKGKEFWPSGKPWSPFDGNIPLPL